MTIEKWGLKFQSPAPGQVDFRYDWKAWLQRQQNECTHCKGTGMNSPVDVQRENSQLRDSLNQLYSVVQGSLVTLDVAIKIGAVVGVWFFPLPAERLPQAVALASYAILVTIISKGLNKMKEIKAKI